MKRSRLVLVLVPVSVLVYLLFLKQHYDSQNALLPLRLPGPAPRAHLTPDWTGRSDAQVQFGIMFDAGSTGTRVHIYKFRLDQSKRLVPELLKETFKAIKPGLSAFADNPEQCRQGLLELLDLARSTVPARFWRSTPVFLKATAGLRLLQGDQADQLLDQVRALFRLSPFDSEDNRVSILDGTDEGISAWITVNFLLGALPRPGPSSRPGSSRTVGMLDLGGGSTQVTFSPQNQETLLSSPSELMQTFTLFNSTYSLYTHSYLGLGLMSARAKILGANSDLAGGAVLFSPCLSEDFRGTWEHNQKNYRLTGQRTGSRFQACWERVQEVLDSVKPVSEPQLFYAFSFYYDRAAEIGAIDVLSGGVVYVSQYQSAAQRVCSAEVQDLNQGSTRSNPGLNKALNRDPNQHPFLCLDLVYISVLLQQLGFTPNSQLKLSRTIKDVETSWALGATFQDMDL